MPPNPRQASNRVSGVHQKNSANDEVDENRSAHNSMSEKTISTDGKEKFVMDSEGNGNNFSLNNVRSFGGHQRNGQYGMNSSMGYGNSMMGMGGGYGMGGYGMGGMGGYGMGGMGGYGMGGMGYGMGGLGMNGGIMGLVTALYGANHILMSFGQLVQIIGGNSQQILVQLGNIRQFIQALLRSVRHPALESWLLKNIRRYKLLKWILMFVSMAVTAHCSRLIQSYLQRNGRGALALSTARGMFSSLLGGGSPNSYSGYTSSGFLDQRVEDISRGGGFPHVDSGVDLDYRWES